MNPPIRVLLADDHQILAESLAFLLATVPQIIIVGKAMDGRQVLSFLELNEVDVVLADIQMPPPNGIDLCLKIKERQPTCSVLILSMFETPELIRDAIRAGAMGYVSKKTDQSELVHAITTVASGHKYFSESVVLRLASLPTEDEAVPKAHEIATLSAREIEVLRLVAQELSTKEIADRVYLSVSTVESYRRSLMQKLDVKSAVGLGIFATKHGLL